jgi:hypothetical protein
VWFSDRGQDTSEAPPNAGQQFSQSQSDLEQMSFTIAGDEVQLDVVLTTWNSSWRASTTVCDVASEQLIFSVPGAGPGAPPAVLIVSFADTGQFGWA